MKLVRNKNGQFIVIAVLMISLMIISLSATMFSMGTYYKQEQWDEYLTLVQHVKSNTQKVTDISLAAYSTPVNPSDTSILKANLNSWQSDLRKAYPGYGIMLTHALASGIHDVYGTEINYNQGLAYQWNEASSFSAVNTTIDLDMMSIGLEGYHFVVTSFLNLTILDVDPGSNEINVTVFKGDNMPIGDLEDDSFQVTGLSISSVTSFYHEQHIFVYRIVCENLESTSATVTVTDQRGIKVIAAK